jgi:hypothetical protein
VSAVDIHIGTLPHDDPEAAPAFYRDEVRSDVGNAKTRWINLGPRDQPGDAEVVQEPAEQPYGVRDCAFRDLAAC